MCARWHQPASIKVRGIPANLRSQPCLPTSFISLSPDASTWWKLARRLAMRSRAKAGADGEVIAAQVNGSARDLAHRLSDGDRVEPIGIKSAAGLAILRHSAAHVLAQAVQELHPEAKLGIGPPVENGFYYDFDVQEAFSPKDLKDLELKMRQIIKQGQRFSRRVVSDDEARAELAAEPYKLELIGLKGGSAASEEESVEVGGGELTIYDNLDAQSGATCWKDLCRGPHLPTTRGIPAFKLMRSGGAYWRGSEKNPQLQRIYGTAWPSRAEQDELPHHAGRGREARPPQARGRARPVLVPDRDRQRAAGVPSQGRDHPPGDGGLLAAPPRGGRVRVRHHPAHHQVDPVRDLGSPGLVRGRDVPAHGDGGREVLPEADELPDAHPDLRRARTVLPGAAAAALRVRHRVPVREVGRGARADQGARVHPGRLAHLLPA